MTVAARREPKDCGTTIGMLEVRESPLPACNHGKSTFVNYDALQVRSNIFSSCGWNLAPKIQKGSDRHAECSGSMDHRATATTMNLD